MRTLLFTALMALFLIGCEEKAVPVTDDNTPSAPAEHHEKGIIETH